MTFELSDDGAAAASSPPHRTLGASVREAMAGIFGLTDEQRESLFRLTYVTASEFQRAWAPLDPLATGRIPVGDLPLMLRSLPEPLGVAALGVDADVLRHRSIALTKRLALIPDTADSVCFHGTLIALTIVANGGAAFGAPVSSVALAGGNPTAERRNASVAETMHAAHERSDAALPPIGLTLHESFSFRSIQAHWRTVRARVSATRALNALRSHVHHSS